MTNRDAVAVMAVVDSLPKAFRSLVHEFGAKIVTDMKAEGYDNAKELRTVLENWRERRQNEWLATQYVTGKTARGFDAAVA